MGKSSIKVTVQQFRFLQKYYQCPSHWEKCSQEEVESVMEILGIDRHTPIAFGLYETGQYGIIVRESEKDSFLFLKIVV